MPTPRSSGVPTAGRQARETERAIIHFAGLASHRCPPPSSNVRPHKRNPAMPNHIFSALLDALQEEYGALTQVQIATALRVSVGTVHNWTNGGEPNKTNLKKLGLTQKKVFKSRQSLL